MFSRVTREELVLAGQVDLVALRQHNVTVSVNITEAKEAGDE